MRLDVGTYGLVWQCGTVQAGRGLEAVLDEAVGLGLGMVALKIADGAALAGGSGSAAQLHDWVNGLRRRGVQVWGWQYLYGGRRLVRNAAGGVVGSEENAYSTVEREAAAAIAQVHALGLDGYVMDVEAEYKTAPRGRAERFMRLLRAGLGSAVAVGLCSYRYPKLHSELDWLSFLARCDCHMPQVYWGQGARGDGLLADGRYLAAVELAASSAQLKALADLPILPVGRAYIGDGHANPRGEELTAFFQQARALGCPGAGFWNWDSLRAGYPGSAGRKAAIAAAGLRAAPLPPEGSVCPLCKRFIPMLRKG